MSQEINYQMIKADFNCWPISEDWRNLVSSFFNTESGVELLSFLANELKAGKVIFPPHPLWALQLTPLCKVRAVILGQDPYHGLGQAQGLAFSVANGMVHPPSLRNIFKEFNRDLGFKAPISGSLESWARAGVLLLNSCLTVEQARANSHAGKGWEILTDKIITELNLQPQPILFLLWGAFAQTKATLITNSRHKILRANHPSPLSANRQPNAFIGCGHFSILNKWLDMDSQSLQLTSQENQLPSLTQRELPLF